MANYKHWFHVHDNSIMVSWRRNNTTWISAGVRRILGALSAWISLKTFYIFQILLYTKTNLHLLYSTKEVFFSRSQHITRILITVTLDITHNRLAKYVFHSKINIVQFINILLEATWTTSLNRFKTKIHSWL